MPHKKNKRQKGCAMCKPYKFKDASMAERRPWRDLRAIGKRRRVTRHDAGDLVPSSS